MKTSKASAVVLVSAVAFFTDCATQGDKIGDRTADTVYRNGKIYTMDEKNPWAEAVAIKDGKFVKVGSNAEVAGFIGKGNLRD